MKSIKYLFPFLISLFFLQFTGCNELNSIPLNIPITITFNNQTGSNINFDSGLYCLSDSSQTYKEYQDKINSLTFVQAAFRTISNSNPDFQGNISATVKNQNGVVLASFQMNNIKPGDYVENPLILHLDQTEISAINAALANSTCLEAIVKITSSGGSTTISGAVDMVFQADTEL